MKSSAKKVELASVDDLFSTEESRADAQREKVCLLYTSVYNTYSYPFCNPETQVAARKAKRFLIAAIIVFGSAIILLILSIILFAMMMAYAV